MFQPIKIFSGGKKIEKLEIKNSETTESLVTVVHRESLLEYYVDLEAGLCSCFKGKQGAPCSHQHKVSLAMKTFNQNTIPTDPQSKMMFHSLAHGKKADIDFYLGLDLNENEVIQSSMSTPTPNSTESSPTDYNTSTEISEPSLNLDWNSLQLRWLNIINKKMENNNEAEYCAIEKATSYLENCSSSGFISALHCMGKSFKSRKQGRTIPVQPTSIGRRKNILATRRHASSGRPKKTSRTDHSYSKPKGMRKKMPHSLQYCVDRNVSVGQ